MSEAKSIFIAGDDSSILLLSWWKGLDQDRGERSGLRRAADPAGVVFGPSFHRLLAQMRAQGYALSPQDASALAAVAGLTAHVKLHVDDRSLAQQMATKSRSGGARVSGLRFRRLLAISDRDELYPMMIRIIRLLDGSVNLVSLANAVFWWNERTKKEWAYSYYETAPKEL